MLKVASLFSLVLIPFSLTKASANDLQADLEKLGPVANSLSSASTVRTQEISANIDNERSRIQEGIIVIDKGSTDGVTTGDLGTVNIDAVLQDGLIEESTQQVPFTVIQVNPDHSTVQVRIEGVPAVASGATVITGSSQNVPTLEVGIAAFTTSDGLSTAQGLMRVGRYTDAMDVLNRLNGETTSERNAIVHHTMFASYALSDFTQTTAEGRNLNDPSAAQASLIAASLIQRGAFAEAQQLLEAAAPTEAVAINLALVYLEQDRNLVVECSNPIMGNREVDDVRDHCRQSSLIAGRQERARTLLSQFPNSILANYNLAILDIEADEFNAARSRMSAVSNAIASTASYDPTVLELKRASLWYVLNYDANVDYLRQNQIPLEILEVAAAGQMLNVIGSGIVGGGISGRDIGNLIATGIAASAAQQQLDEVTAVLRDNFRRNINFVPAAAPPDDLNYTIF